jgi:hypothetical protein
MKRRREIKKQIHLVTGDYNNYNDFDKYENAILTVLAHYRIPLQS